MSETTLEIQEFEDGTIMAEGEHDPATFLEAARRVVGGLEDVGLDEITSGTWWRSDEGPEGPYYHYDAAKAERDGVPGRPVRITSIDG